jgi:hypothetical protein
MIPKVHCDVHINSPLDSSPHIRAQFPRIIYQVNSRLVALLKVVFVKISSICSRMFDYIVSRHSLLKPSAFIWTRSYNRWNLVLFL